jgi:inner membrane protein
MEIGSASFWIIFGVILLLIELFSITFFAMFFGIGALFTGVLVSFGVLDDLTAQIAIFAIASMLSVYFFRKKFKEIFNKKGKEYNEFEGEIAQVSLLIPENGEGKVYYRGTDWLAYSKNGNEIAKDTKVKINKVDGIKLIVEQI